MLQPALNRSEAVEQPIIQARALIYGYGGAGRGLFRRRTAVHYAVNDVSFDIYPGETLGLVGESGSGKTTIGRMVSATLRPHGGAVELHGEPFANPMPLQRRSRIQSVFQDSLGVLNPRLRIGRQLEEPMIIHGIDKAERRKRIASLLSDVGLPERALERFPGEVSGGQRQRVLLARALVLRPDVLVCDEPVSALDVSIQAQVINLLADLKQHHALTMLFISHAGRTASVRPDRSAVRRAHRRDRSGRRRHRRAETSLHETVGGCAAAGPAGRAPAQVRAIRAETCRGGHDRNRMRVRSALPEGATLLRSVRAAAAPGAAAA